MRISENVRKLRKEKGWTQYRLAMEANVSQQAISFIERERNEPSAEMIRALAGALQVSTAELLGEDILLSDHKLTPREFAMISEFRKLNPAGQKHLIELATFYQTKDEYKRK